MNRTDRKTVGIRRRSRTNPAGRSSLAPPDFPEDTIEPSTTTPYAGVAARLRARWYLVIIAALVSVAAGGTVLYRVDHNGLKKKQRTFQVGSAELLVDLNPSTLTNATVQAVALNGKAQLIAQYATGPKVVAQIARRSKVPVSRLTVQAVVTSPNSIGGTRSKGITTGSLKNNAVLLSATSQGQTIQISSQAKTPARALALARATVASIRASLSTLQKSQPINRSTPNLPTVNASSSSSISGSSTTTSSTTPAQPGVAAAATKRANAIALSKIVLRPLGSVSVQLVNSSPKKSKAVGYAVGAFVILLIVILLLDNLLRGRRRRSAPVPIAAQPDTETAEESRDESSSSNGSTDGSSDEAVHEPQTSSAQQD